MAKSAKAIKPKWFYCDLYQENIYFVDSKSVEEFKKSMFQCFKIELNIGANVKGCCIWGEKIPGVAMWINSKNIPDLAHEAVHAANYILETKGILPQYDNDEAQAYLVGWIVKKILELK